MLDVPVRPDGRWAKILAALSGRPTSFGFLVATVRDPKHIYSLDRRKCRYAVKALQKAGLIAGTWGRLEITDLGRTIFAQLKAEEMQA